MPPSLLDDQDKGDEAIGQDNKTQEREKKRERERKREKN